MLTISSIKTGDVCRFLEDMAYALPMLRCVFISTLPTTHKGNMFVLPKSESSRTNLQANCMVLPLNGLGAVESVN